MDTSWQLIIDVLILLAAALLLGTVAEQLRQSAILGYLLAGTLVGPKVFALVGSVEEVEVIAELGVALLLFTIGLEFSLRRLRRLGAVALVGGSLQVVFTMLCAAAAAVLLGLKLDGAMAVGAIVALSSTACVLRLLMDRAALDSIYGRNALGILLLQDVAVIPLILLLSALGAGDASRSAGLVLLQTTGMAAALIGTFFILFNFVVPRLLNIRQWVKNRDLPILLAIVVALGAVVAAHAVGISPATGAFIAGVILGGSPFAVQIRADVSSVRTLLVTVFFASIGLLGDPGWMMDHWIMVASAVAAIVAGKVFIIWIILRFLQLTHGLAVATGLCLAQVGEFSFVLAAIARGGLIDDDVFRLIISAMIITLFLTPFLVTAAPKVTVLVEAWRHRRATTGRSSARGGGDAGAPAPGATEEAAGAPRRIFIIGFGPAGQRVAQALLARHRAKIVVIDLNTRNIETASGIGLAAQLGDASHRDVLEHAHVHRAEVIVITVPDPAASRTMIHHCRFLAPDAAIVVRARYHILQWELHLAGATKVVDEEDHVGLRLAAEARKHLRADRDR